MKKRTRKQESFWGVFGLIVALSWSCMPKTLSKRSKSSDTFQADIGAAKLSTHLVQYNPDTLAVKLGAIKLVPNGLTDDIKYLAPSFTIEKGHASFVKIMRCNAGYVLRTVTGQRLESLAGLTNALDERKDMWLIAFSEYDNCKLVAENYVLSSFVDISAKTGTYYYVVNPCINAENSSSGRQSCSYNFGLTESIQFENKMLEAATELAAGLQRATNAMFAAIHKVGREAELFNLRLTACQNHVARRTNINQVRQGMLSLALFITGAVTFDRMGPLSKIPVLKKVTGPNAGMMGGLMTQSMAGPPIYKTLGIEIQSDTCLAGPPSAEDAKKFHLSIAKAEALEAEFGVRSSLKAIERIIKQDPNRTGSEPLGTILPGDGTISQTLQRMRLIQNNMAKMDTNILKFDALLVQANKAGLNLKDWDGLIQMVQQAAASSDPTTEAGTGGPQQELQ